VALAAAEQQEVAAAAATSELQAARKQHEALVSELSSKKELLARQLQVRGSCMS
jgi:hypothetical protein